MQRDILEKRYYGGCEVVDEIENLAIDRLCTLFWCQLRQCTTSPGAQANAAVFGLSSAWRRYFRF